MAEEKKLPKHSSHEGDVCDKLAEKAQTIFAKEYDYAVLKIKDLQEHAHEIHELASYLSGNQYYSDALARTVFELKIDADLLVLKIERDSLMHSAYVNDLEKAILREEKPKFSKEDIAALSKSVDSHLKNLDDIYARAYEMVGKIKDEFKQRTH